MTTLKEHSANYLAVNGGVSWRAAKVAANAIVENLPPVYDAAPTLLDALFPNGKPSVSKLLCSRGYEYEANRIDAAIALTEKRQ